MKEHNGCQGCIHVDEEANEFPCKICKGANGEIDMWGERKDVVNHPSHYCQDGGMECIDEMIAVFGKEWVKIFCFLNVWKYRKRAVFKNGEEDMKKSDWYMKKYLELGGEQKEV